MRSYFPFISASLFHSFIDDFQDEKFNKRYVKDDGDDDEDDDEDEDEDEEVRKEVEPYSPKFVLNGEHVRVLLAVHSKTQAKTLNTGVCIYWDKDHPENRAYPFTSEAPYTRAQAQIMGEILERTTAFLDASTHLYMRVCLAIRPSVCPSVVCPAFSSNLGIHLKTQFKVRVRVKVRI